MTNFTRRAALGMAGGAAVLPLLGSPALANTKLTVGALRFTSHAASFVAYERGYFTDEGLDVEFKFFEAAQPMAVAIASQDADFGVTSITGGLISLAEKGAAKVIAGALSEEKGIDGQMILASNAAYDAGLTAPAALDGKSFAVTQPGSSFHYMGAKIAEAEGVSLSYKPLQKTVFTSAKNASEDRAKTEAFLRAFSRGADDFNAALVDKTVDAAQQEEMVKLIHKYVYEDQPFEKASTSIINGAMRINKDGALNMGSVNDQVDWFKSEGLIKDSITVDTLVDTSYVELT